ncbi:MAG TPA: glycosyltransferase family 2 protein [Steroidobacteraceae bacterium]|nr:glycosyltransferase family 2 protein [Steroidobacteraceae bacterium]
MSPEIVPGLPNGKQVCAIAVTYHPDGEFPARISRILPQVGALVIVDNGSATAEVGMLREIAANPMISLVLNPGNFGIARALNIGIERALSMGFKWTLLLDQDSVPDDDMVQTLLAVHADFPDKDRLAVVGSGFRDVDSKEPTPIKVGDNWVEVECVITSGSLIPLAVHAAVGAFREEFFIDYVDIEYCYRARARGFRVIKTRAALMSHSIGAITRHNLLGFKKWTYNHSPDRRYYIARNDTVLLREYGQYALGLWALKSLSRCIRLCKRIALYEQMKSRKMAAVAQGWWDGVRGHLGPRG